MADPMESVKANGNEDSGKSIEKSHGAKSVEDTADEADAECEVNEAYEADAEDAENMTDEADAEDAKNRRKKKRRRGLKIVRNVLFCAAVTAVCVFLLAVYVFPIMKIYGSAMSPTLFDGDIVVVHKTASLKRGDVCIFSVGESSLCRRVIGIGGDEISVDGDGNLLVNGEKQKGLFSEDAVSGGTASYPLTVPQNSYFVIGDSHRTSVDSRSNVVGCVDSSQMIGKAFLKLLPLPEFIDGTE